MECNFVQIFAEIALSVQTIDMFWKYFSSKTTYASRTYNIEKFGDS